MRRSPWPGVAERQRTGEVAIIIPDDCQMRHHYSISPAKSDKASRLNR